MTKYRLRLRLADGTVVDNINDAVLEAVTETGQLAWKSNLEVYVRKFNYFAKQILGKSPSGSEHIRV